MSDAMISAKYVDVLSEIFDGPRWLTAPVGMRLTRPIEVRYCISWSGKASVVAAEIEEDPGCYTFGDGPTGQDAHDRIVAEILSPARCQGTVFLKGQP